MSQQEIKSMITAIKTKYAKEITDYHVELEFHEMSPHEQRIANRFYDNVRRRMQYTIIMQVGDYIIRPYARDPQKTIAIFLKHVEHQYHYDHRKNLHPTLDEFISWYCDSNVIQRESENERFNINDDPRPLHYQP